MNILQRVGALGDVILKALLKALLGDTDNTTTTTTTTVNASPKRVLEVEGVSEPVLMILDAIKTRPNSFSTINISCDQSSDHVRRLRTTEVFTITDRQTKLTVCATVVNRDWVTTLVVAGAHQIEFTGTEKKMLLKAYKELVDARKERLNTIQRNFWSSKYQCNTIGR